MTTTIPSQLLDEARVRVRELITTSPFYQQGLLEIAALLPESDDELHGWLEETVAERNASEFIFVICAAALAGRRLRASLLPGGTMMMPDPDRFAWIAWHMEGDVTAHLLAALERQAINPQTEATLLFVAAAWWQKHREGAIPRPILSAARRLQRREDEFNQEAQNSLAALQILTKDEGMLALSPMARCADLRAAAMGLKEAMLHSMDGPFSALIAEKRQHGFKRGTPMRRSVEELGRNAPCRCGSGRKYKKCCQPADQKRLQLSTDVAGKTWLELEGDPDSDLTLPRLQRLQPATLARLNPTKVPADLLPEYLMRLAAFGLFDDLAAAFEKLGVTEELEPLWKRLFLFVIRSWRRDAAQRLVEAHPRGVAVLPDTAAGLRLLLASDDAASFLEALEREALAVLESNDREETQSLALAFLASPYKALGTFFTRSLLPLDGLELSFLFTEILRARDALCLPGEDEFSDFVEERVASRRQPDDSPALREAREEHDRKAEEVRRVREELATARRQLTLADKREKRLDAATVAAGHAPRVEDEAIQKLRAREKELEALLTDRRQERLTQRREIEKLRQEVAMLRAGETSAVTPARDAREAEDDPGRPLEATGQQPLRLLAFPKKFREKLEAFPPQVGRVVMTQLGRIASGDPTAFAGLKRLQECEELVRARVAGDYRLLMHFTLEQVQVVDVVNRRDLQKRLRTLRATGLPAFLA